MILKSVAFPHQIFFNFAFHFLYGGTPKNITRFVSQVCYGVEVIYISIIA